MKILGNVIKSQSDQRLYKAIRLKNQIECLIITDQEAKKSSAALSVGVGSLQDPFEAQGLAHYLEHMLFMGTKKYPNENDYSNFIAKNFGVSNAYTSQQETNYHFEVSSNAFEETLDRFAQFFISPVMSDSSSERQLNAVHSQHSKNIQSDMWRKFQLTKHLAIPGHPLNKFSTGDKNSLASPNLRELLHRFYQTTYSSNLMKLVVYGDKDPQVMMQLVEEKFSEVPNKSYSRFKMLDIPYAPESFNKIYKITPVKDKKVIDISWLLPDQSKYYENSPGQYLSHLVGHEGKGSLLSYLIKEGLAVGLSCHSHDAYDCFSEFEVTISLTNHGIQNVKRVIGHVLYYIEMLQKSQPEEWVFREIQAMNKMRFDFQQKRKGMSFASSIVKRLHDHPIEEVLAYPYFMKEWKPDLIRDYLSHLKSSNMMIFVEAKEVESECNLEEPIYKTKYGIEDIKGIAPISCNVSLPEPNIFIPKDFQILPLGQSQYPIELKEQCSDRMSLFFKQDHRFALPKILLSWRLYFPGGITAKEAVIRQIYFQMLNESLREFTYLAETAQAHLSVSSGTHFYFDISISGFRDSAMKLSIPYFERIFGFKPEDQQYFSTVKERLKRNYQNFFLSDPYRLAYNSLLMALRHNLGVPTEERLAEVDNITFDDVLRFSEVWNKNLYMQSYVGGNLEERDGIKLAKQIEALVKNTSSALPKSKIDQIRAVSLPANKTWVIQEKLKSKDEENSAVIVHFQHEATTLRSKVLQDLCIYFVKEPAFDYLRTKQQLGYIVMCMPDDTRGVLGISILVQSAIKTSYQLSSHVDIFLKDILSKKLNDLNEEEFAAFKNSLRMSKLEKDKNLIAESQRYVNQINKHSYLFNRKELELAELETITLEEFKNFIQIVFYMNCKRLEVHSVSHKDHERNQEQRKNRLANDSNVRVLSDPETFRKKMSLYPDFYGHL